MNVARDDRVLALASDILCHDEHLSWFFLMEWAGMPTGLADSFGMICTAQPIIVDMIIPPKKKKVDSLCWWE
jgi:hypothetical protein